ncbi:MULTISPECIES: M48 family metallopeptidase [Haloarcula]|uniref:M48 family metallopeptidase n=1 Tax=Haloarcula TaxID=2237 RepID=UPI0023E7F22C|nr:SprT family zinc-dependent metalloprotease [Halomicroarcula sp. SHR3]
MTRQYHIGQTVVPYEIDWSEDRETIGLSIDSSMELTVQAPMSATLSDVESTLDDKQPWILETLYGLGEQSDPPLDKEFLSGEKLLYRGRQYRLKVQEADVPEPTVSFDGNEFTLQVHRFDKPADGVSVRRKRQAVVDWYYKQAENELRERFETHGPKLGATDVSVEVTDFDDRWGEYEDGVIRLHWRLVLAPVRIQDYVVVHELAHTKHDRHSAGFWNTVGSVIPDYEDRREWLRLNGNTLTV